MQPLPCVLIDFCRLQLFPVLLLCGQEPRRFGHRLTFQIGCVRIEVDDSQRSLARIALSDLVS